LLGERAEPFAIVSDQAPKLPLRQLKFKHCKGCVGPSANFDQLVDVSVHMGSMSGKADARLPDHIRHQFRRDRLGAAKLVFRAPSAAPRRNFVRAEVARSRHARDSAILIVAATAMSVGSAL